MTLTTERILPNPFGPAANAQVNFGNAGGEPRSNRSKLGVRRSINRLGVFPPEVQLAMKLDRNFSVGVDQNSGTHYLVIDPAIAKGTRVNIYV